MNIAFPKLPLTLWAMTPVIVLGPALTCVAPRIMALLFIASGLMAIASDCFQRRSWPRIDTRLGAIFAAFILYGLGSYFWSINPDASLSKAGQLTWIFGITCFLMPIIGNLSHNDLHRMGRMLLVGLGTGIAVFLFEAASGFKLYDLVRNGHSLDIADIKQNKAAVLICFWAYVSLPFLYLSKSKKSLWWVSILAVLTYAVTFISQSDSAQEILIVVPVFALIIYKISIKNSLRLTSLGVVAVTVLMPVIALGLYNHTGWKNPEWLPNSIKARIEIWDQAARRIEERPVLGWGLNTSPDLPNRGEYSQLPGPQAPIAHLHPHNAPLQIWFESGIPGMLLMAALCMVFYHRINQLRLPRLHQYATFLLGTVFAYTLTIWGIWQSWFIASLCFTGVMGYAFIRYGEGVLKRPGDQG